MTTPSHLLHDQTLESFGRTAAAMSCISASGFPMFKQACGSANFRKRQTCNATPAEPGGLPWWLDGGEYGTAASDYVLEHRPLWGPRPVVTLIHVRPPKHGGSMPRHESTLVPTVDEAEVARVEDAAFEQVLAPVRQKFEQAQFAVQEQRIVGQAGHAIADFARTAGLDILVMGSHGRGSLTAAVLGSVAWRTAATCATPLLLIRKITSAPTAD